MPEKDNTNELIMDQPFKIITDIWGVITSWNFKNDLISYFNQSLFNYLDANWTQAFIIDFVKNLTEDTLKERSTDEGKDMPRILSGVTDREAVIHSIVDNIKWRTDNKYKATGILESLKNSVWFDGYKDGSLKSDAFDDVIPAFKKWCSDPLYIKIYSFASGDPETQKLFLSSSKCGNINEFVIKGINSFQKYKHDEQKFKAVINLLFERKPQNILYLTDSVRKAKASKKAGMRAVIVLRPGNKKYTEQELNDLNRVSSLNDLHFVSAN